MTDRRFSETEVAEIFRRASETQEGARAPLASRDGMTLGALQEIGREVGLSPEAIATAARSLERAGTEGRRDFFGFPLGVYRVVRLDRRLTETEWERLVVDLRETFDARGKLGGEGGFRQWTNGNLQALLEPVGDTHQLRLKTTHGGSRALMTAGLATLAFGAVLGIASMIAGADAGVWARSGMPLVVGGALFLAGALRLPRWARIRRQQMREIADRVTGPTPP